MRNYARCAARLGAGNDATLRALLKGRARRLAFRALAKCAAIRRSMDLSLMSFLRRAARKMATPKKATLNANPRITTEISTLIIRSSLRSRNTRVRTHKAVLCSVYSAIALLRSSHDLQAQRRPVLVDGDLRPGLNKGQVLSLIFKLGC